MKKSKKKAVKKKSEKKVAMKKIIKEKPKKRQIDPLPGTFMLTSMFGLIITLIYTSSGRIPIDYGVAFSIVFLIMFIASLKSITPSKNI